MFCPNCGEPHELKANFCSACGTKLARKGSSPLPPPAGGRTPPLPELDGNRTPPQPVKVLDAGDRLLITGGNAEEVQQALDRLVAMGAKVLTALCQVGRSWTAACTLPAKAESIDDTGSLSLAEVKKAAAGKHGYDADDGCRVEELGFKRMVFGPSRLAVQRRFEHMKQFGAQLVGEIEQIDEEWVAVLDMDAGSTYRW